MVISHRLALFTPHVPAIGSLWPKCLVHQFHYAGKTYGKTMLFAELVAIDYKSGKCLVQYWHDERKEIAGGLVWERIGELPAISGEIDSSYRGKFERIQQVKSYDEFESVTSDDEPAAAAGESVTAGNCQVCGNPCSTRAKTCSPKCRKRLSRVNAG